MSNIRPATVADLPVCAEIGKEFYKEGKLPGAMITEEFVKTWTMLFDMGLGVMFVLEQDGVVKGGIGGVVTKDPNDGALTATEMFWFVLPDSRGGGLGLLEAFENSAKKAGAKRIGMIHLLNLMPDVLAKLYTRRGYKAIETHYIKELT